MVTETHGQEISHLQAERLRKLNDLKAMGINPYPYNFKRSDLCAELQDKYKDLANEERTEDTVIVAGRVHNQRNDWMFIDLHDVSGRIQLFSDAKSRPEYLQNFLPLLDKGDIIGAKGKIRRTPRGELTIDIEEVTLLSKTLQPLPEIIEGKNRRLGITDVETRYRQRYIDLIVNPQSKENLKRRAILVREIRRFLDDQDFVEIETPILNTEAGGAAARPFITHHNALDMGLYLRIATELHLKRLAVGGFERVYEIGRIFRNEGISIKHNPEFTSIEVYWAYTDLYDMMELTENLIKHVCHKVTNGLVINYQGTEIDFSKPFRRVTMQDLVKEVTGKDLTGKALNEAFEQHCEATLIQPTFVYDYPVEISPLAKKHRDKEGFVERFELFIYGRETANAFSELTDPIDQKQRFLDQVQERVGGDDEAHVMDEDFVTALEYGLPPTSGMGLGIDRFAMILTDSASIRDVIAFPTMKKLN
ncbi:MAG: lysine--tRNA ligase [Candidatus Caenarcaniphilales bacterium]|jgi:lysyl-tRNA synthetase class 2|nr:lysine--tRNA ligase [Candidatus Caenarcaniphilales bacterium]